MNWKKGLFTNIMTSGMCLSGDIEHRNRTIFMNTVIIIGVIFMTIFSISDFKLGEIYFALILFVLILLQFILFFLARNKKYQTIVRYFLVALSQVFFLYLTITGGMNGSGIFWTFTFPLIAFFLLGKKGGITFSITNGIILAFILLYQPLHLVDTSLIYNFRALASYTVVSLFSYLFEMILLSSQQKILQSKKRIENTNKKLSHTLIELTATKESLVESEKFAAIGRLVAGIAHEINTPLGNSVTAASLIHDSIEEVAREMGAGSLTRSRFNDLMELLRKAQSSLDKNLERSASLIANFKQLSVDQMQEENRHFNLKHYVDSVLLALYPTLKKTSIEIQVNIPESLELYSIPGLWSQIITNLIQNSLIHGYKKNAKGIIQLDFKKNNDTLTFIFKNDGKGIKESRISRIFEPFYSTAKDKGGTGLGLSILYNIITAKLNGTVSCQSPSGKGVIFTITVPL